MTRWTLIVSSLVFGICQAGALADCPAGYPNEIFCDSFDTYCTGGGYPGSPDCASGSTKDDTPLQTVWQTTSVDDTTGLPCGTQFIVDDNPVYLSSLLFGGRHPCLTNDPIGQQSVSNWNVSPATPGIDFRIQSVFPGYDKVSGTTAAPLVLEFYLSGVNKPEWGIGGGLTRSTAYMELALANDRANTDYVSSPYCGLPSPPGCANPIKQGPFPIMCAVGNPENGLPLPTGCPALASAPVHAAVAVGTMPMLDPDPCHCGETDHGPINIHLVLYDGQIWWNLRSNSPLASSGTITPEDPNAPMPPPADLNTPGHFQLMAGKPGGDGPPNQWVKLTIKTSTFDVEMTAREKSAENGYVYLVKSVMNDIERKYLGCFDQLRGGMGAGCELATSSSWTNNCAGGGRTCIVSHKNNANAVIFDDVVLHGGAGYSIYGACCLDNADCVDNETKEHCEAEIPGGLGGHWQGSDTTCDTLTCCPYPFADADHDGDVDQVDFAAFQLCYTGSGGGVPQGCECWNRDKDNDVDNNDFTALNDCWTGPNVPYSVALPSSCTP